MIPKDYNSAREKLLFPEYGRHIQNMVKGLSTIEDIEERTRQAYIVIDVMGNLNSNLRDTADFKHKLWDHLFLLSDFKLEVNAPYDTPTQEELYPSPQKIAYPKQVFGYKQYGMNIRRVIDLIKDKDMCDSKESTISDILKFMKFKSYEYNQEYPSNEVVINHFRSFYRKEIEIDSEILSSVKINVKKKPVNSSLSRKDGLRTYRTTPTGTHRPTSSSTSSSYRSPSSSSSSSYRPSSGSSSSSYRPSSGSSSSSYRSTSSTSGNSYKPTSSTSGNTYKPSTTASSNTNTYKPSTTASTPTTGTYKPTTGASSSSNTHSNTHSSSNSSTNRNNPKVQGAATPRRYLKHTENKK